MTKSALTCKPSSQPGHSKKQRAKTKNLEEPANNRRNRPLAGTLGETLEGDSFQKAGLAELNVGKKGGKARLSEGKRGKYRDGLGASNYG